MAVGLSLSGPEVEEVVMVSSGAGPQPAIVRANTTVRRFGIFTLLSRAHYLKPVLAMGVGSDVN
jgi:hypothetical protein